MIANSVFSEHAIITFTINVQIMWVSSIDSVQSRVTNNYYSYMYVILISLCNQRPACGVHFLDYYSTVQYSTVQCSTVQYSTVSTVQYIAVQ